MEYIKINNHVSDEMVLYPTVHTGTQKKRLNQVPSWKTPEYSTSCIKTHRQSKM